MPGIYGRSIFKTKNIMTIRESSAIGMAKRQFSANNNGRGMPALRIALTSNCNLNCNYCPPKGENFCHVRNQIKTERLLKILNVFYEIGFRQFGFTGGEPLLNNHLSVILKERFRFKGIHLKLYTNGTLLKNKISILKEFDLIKLSLDSINRKKYQEITGKDKLEDILKGIQFAKKNKVKMRINTVLTQKNYDEIFNIIDFCRNNELDLKILDLNCFDKPGYLAWKDLYRTPSRIANFLEKKALSKRTIYTTGKYGIPMGEFCYEGISIRIKDTKHNSVYSPLCQNCRYFLCQEGLYHLTLTSDGKLKMCRHRPDIHMDLSQKTDSEIKESSLAFLKKHYLSAKRLFSQKQVFLGHFGTNGNYKRKKS